MWNIILTLIICLFLACLSSAMLMLFLCDEYFVNNVDEQNEILSVVLILNYIMLIALVFSGTISLGVLAVVIIGLFFIVNVI